MGEVIEASQLPMEEKVYLKKDYFGWRIVQPIKNEDGSYNWFNLILGGKRGLFILGLILFIVSMLYFGISYMIGQYKFPFDNPVEFCTQYVKLIN